MNVLISTLPDDDHAHIVAAGLRQRGHVPIMLYPFDLCGGATWSYDACGARLEILTPGVQQPSVTRVAHVDAFWVRRVPRIFPIESIADIRERAAAETELERLVSGVVEAISADTFCVNAFEATLRAAHKPLQIRIARRIGFKVPRTLVTNDLGSIKAFHAACGGRIVYKPLSLFLWSDTKQEYATNAWTTLIDDLAIFDDVDVALSPGIYQEVVKKRAEVRVMVMGRSTHAWCSRPRDGAPICEVDWRIEKRRFVYERHEVSEEVRQLCFQMMDSLGIVFGCFDFAIDEAGNYVFFEVNPAGQFLSLQDCSNAYFNMLDPFVRFLESRNPRFEYEWPDDMLFVEGITAECERERAEAHFGSLKTHHFARASVSFL